MKNTVDGILDRKYKILEKIVMKAMRSLKREATKSGGRIGFVFNQIKASVKKICKNKKRVRNVTLIKTLENLRNDGKIVLKKGRNYLNKNKSAKHKNSKEANKKVSMRKVSRKKVSKKNGKLKRNGKKSKKQTKTENTIKKKAKNSKKLKSVKKEKADKDSESSRKNSEVSIISSESNEFFTYNASFADEILDEAKRESINELREPTTTEETQ